MQGTTQLRWKMHLREQSQSWKKRKRPNDKGSNEEFVSSWYEGTRLKLIIRYWISKSDRPLRTSLWWFTASRSKHGCWFKLSLKLGLAIVISYFGPTIVNEYVNEWQVRLIATNHWIKSCGIRCLLTATWTRTWAGWDAV